MTLMPLMLMTLMPSHRRTCMQACCMTLMRLMHMTFRHMTPTALMQLMALTPPHCIFMCAWYVTLTTLMLMTLTPPHCIFMCVWYVTLTTLMLTTLMLSYRMAYRQALHMMLVRHIPHMHMSVRHMALMPPHLMTHMQVWYTTFMPRLPRLRLAQRPRPRLARLPRLR
jgi:hypothetical protein